MGFVVFKENLILYSCYELMYDSVHFTKSPITAFLLLRCSAFLNNCDSSKVVLVIVNIVILWIFLWSRLRKMDRRRRVFRDK